MVQFEKTIKEQRQKLFDALEDQESKFLKEKALLLKDLDEQKGAFREVALKEARLAMGEEARKIMAENNRLNSTTVSYMRVCVCDFLTARRCL
jgi:hypothetical protein